MSIFPGQTGEWAALNLNLPACSEQPIGILLVDTADQLHVRFRPDWSTVVENEEYTAILTELKEDLEAKGRDLGGAAVLEWFERSASHALQLGERHPIEIGDVRETVEELFSRAVIRTEAPTQQDDREQKRDYVRVAIAGALLVATIVAAAKVTYTTGRSVSKSASSYARDASVLLEFPLRPTPVLPLQSGSYFAPLLHRSFARHKGGERVHRMFVVTECVTVTRPKRQVVHIDEAPGNEIAASNSTWALDLIPERPPFQARRNRFVQFLCRVASPFRRLFSPRDIGETTFN